MGSTAELKKAFDQLWEWPEAGDEWSTWWGGTPALWYGGILPRVHSFLPARRILEIAPGFGRWTQYLKDQCEHLTLVDLAPKCIDHCRQRFAGANHIEYHVNDGRSLAMVPDGSVDFIFSWDSLVHADGDIIGDYLNQLRYKLTPNGVGFIHHSNVGAHKWAYSVAMAVAKSAPSTVLRALVDRGILLDVYAWRSPKMDAAAAAAMCERAGLACIGQEVLTWEHGRFRTDAITTFALPASPWARQPRVVRTRSFRAEARRMRDLYASTGFAGSGLRRP